MASIRCAFGTCEAKGAGEISWWTTESPVRRAPPRRCSCRPTETRSLYLPSQFATHVMPRSSAPQALSAVRRSPGHFLKFPSHAKHASQFFQVNLIWHKQNQTLSHMRACARAVRRAARCAAARALIATRISTAVRTHMHTHTPSCARTIILQVWAMLLEKAFAKLFGSYGALYGGFMLWGMQAGVLSFAWPCPFPSPHPPPGRIVARSGQLPILPRCRIFLLASPACFPPPCPASRRFPKSTIEPEAQPFPLPPTSLRASQPTADRRLHRPSPVTGFWHCR
jgi:hypothetical protein